MPQRTRRKGQVSARISSIDLDVPIPAGKRRSGFVPGTQIRKSDVIDQVFEKWLSGNSLELFKRGVLCNIAGEYVANYLGREPNSADEFIQTRKFIQKKIREKYKHSFNEINSLT